MRWDNFAILRTICAIPRGTRVKYTRVHVARMFAAGSAGEMTSAIPELFYAFGPQLNTFMSGGISLE